MSANGPHTVLVVDDKPAKRYTIARLLRAAGFETLEAGSGREAIDQAARAPDAIVLDVNLPDIDGYEVCRLLRAREDTARTPIIHISATFTDAADKVSGFDAGADGYLTHPVEPPVLIATVRAFIRARRAEEGLRRSEETFRLVFDMAPIGIALFGSDRRIVEANLAMSDLLGLPGQSLAGESFLRFVPPETLAGSEARWAELRRRGEWRGVTLMQKADGSPIYVDATISLHSGPDTWITMLTDVTQRVLAEADRERLHASERAARTEAERANRVKDDFLATISHELRAPLQAIVGWSQLLRNRAPSDVADYRMGIEAIHRNARLQSQLITDLLDVSRIASGKLRLDRRELDLAESIAHALDSLGDTAQARQLSVQTRLDPGDLRVFGDAGRIQQVLVNLLTNAVKFTPVGGSIEISALRDGDWIDLAVADDGQGIGPEFLPHIFDAFRQEDSAPSRRHEGLGLGLSIVRRIAEMHGGSVSVASAGLGQGATFTVRLPTLAAARSAGAAADAAAADAHEPELLRDLRVLIVDDDADARQLVRRLLDDHAVRSAEAGGMAEALELVRSTDPQVLISDISMPGGDGYSLVRQLRESGYDAERLPAIALTAFARPEDRLRALAEGFQVHLGKPIDLESLLVAIVGVAPRRH